MIWLTELVGNRENPVLVNLGRVCVIGVAPDGRTTVMFDGGLLPVKETLAEISARVRPGGPSDQHSEECACLECR